MLRFVCFGALLLLSAASDPEAFSCQHNTGDECVDYASMMQIMLQIGKVQDCYSKYDGMPLLHLKACTQGISSQLEVLGCTILDDHFEYATECSGTEVVCSKQAAAELEKGWVATMVSSDAGALWRQSSGVTMALIGGLSATSSFYTAWRDLDAQNAQVEALVNASDGVATLETVGQSLEGRDMRIVRFRGAGYSPGGVRVVVSYNMHAREWITGMSGVYQVERLIEKVRQDPSYLAGIEVVIMPMANPDGFHYSTIANRMHRKNMRVVGSGCMGVDLNRNWDAYWAQGGSSSNPCSDTYHGTRAASEPETNVLAQVINEMQTTVYINVESYSQLIMSSYSYTTATNPRSSEYRAIGGSIQSAIRAIGGHTWIEGPIAQVLYQASGTSVDYADKLGALGILLSLRPGRAGGGGFAPPASDIRIGAQESYAGVMAAIDYAKAHSPARPTDTGSSG